MLSYYGGRAFFSSLTDWLFQLTTVVWRGCGTLQTGRTGRLGCWPRDSRTLAAAWRDYTSRKPKIDLNPQRKSKGAFRRDLCAGSLIRSKMCLMCVFLKEINGDSMAMELK